MSVARRSLLFCFFLLAACSRHPRLERFTTDGCSLFPDSDTQRGDSWCECCVDHDIAYWKGGPDSERRIADSVLSACILKRTGDTILADIVYAGTRAGGSGYFPTWYRWGYGWPYRMTAIPDSVRDREIRRRGKVDRAASVRKECGEGAASRKVLLRAETKKAPPERGPGKP
jgi:hypothetical protein